MIGPIIVGQNEYARIIIYNGYITVRMFDCVCTPRMQSIGGREIEDICKFTPKVALSRTGLQEPKKEHRKANDHYFIEILFFIIFLYVLGLLELVTLDFLSFLAFQESNPVAAILWGVLPQSHQSLYMYNRVTFVTGPV